MALPISDPDKLTDRQRLVSLFLSYEYGDLVAYETINDLLGYDIQKVKRHVVSSARKDLENLHHRSIEAVVNEGYRVVTPEEHLRLARQRKQAADRKYGDSRRVLDAADRDLVSKPVADEMDAFGERLGMVEDSVYLIQRRQGRQEAALEGVRDTQMHDRKETQERLRRLEESWERYRKDLPDED